MSVRILIVDDSATARLALRLALEAESDIEVVGEVETGHETLRALKRLEPDLVTLDLFLGRENGLDVAEGIMAEHAVPIVLVTAADASDPSLIYRAMRIGVLEVCAKLPGPDHAEYDRRRRQLARLLKTMATVPVVHRKGRRISDGVPRPPPPIERAPAAPATRSGPGSGLLVIGASTGGPPVVSKLLSELPAPFPHPIALAQHIMSDFVDGFARWLDDVTPHSVTLTEQSEALEPGRVYVARAEHHLVIQSSRTIGVSEDGPIRHHRPSIDYLFEGAATHFGSRAVAVLLTGMGDDGALGMESLRQAGAHTLAQDPSTCVVSSMPRKAMERDGVARVARPSELPSLIQSAFGPSPVRARR